MGLTQSSLHEERIIRRLNVVIVLMVLGFLTDLVQRTLAWLGR